MCQQPPYVLRTCSKKARGGCASGNLDSEPPLMQKCLSIYSQGRLVNNSVTESLDSTGERLEASTK